MKTRSGVRKERRVFYQASLTAGRLGYYNIDTSKMSTFSFKNMCTMCICKTEVQSNRTIKKSPTLTPIPSAGLKRMPESQNPGRLN
jgi:hypothetical protein